MKRFGLAAFTAVAVLATPIAATADDKLTYDDLVNCAAFNKVVSDVYGSGNDAANNKDKIEAFKGQSVALMAIAAVGAGKTAEQVHADMTKQSETVLAAMADKTSGSDYISKTYDKCDTMGKAAVSIVEDTKKGK